MVSCWRLVKIILGLNDTVLRDELLFCLRTFSSELKNKKVRQDWISDLKSLCDWKFQQEHETYLDLQVKFKTYMWMLLLQPDVTQSSNWLSSQLQ